MTTSDDTTGFEASRPAPSGETTGSGASRPAPDHHPFTQPVAEQRLHRGHPRLLGGVASGVADYFDVDPTIVRIAFVALAFISGGLALPLYAAGWLLIPDGTSDRSIAEDLFDRDRDRARAY